MIWGFPAAFYFFSLALPIAAVFFYRHFAKVRDVPAVQAWAELGRPVESRSFHSLLRRILALLAQLLLLALLVLALADPAPQVPAARVILVLDAGATMHTREGAAATRFDLARGQAEELLARLPAEAQVAIIQAAHCPTLVSPPTRDRDATLAALRALAPLDVDSDLASAIHSADAFIDRRMPTEVVAWSDFAAADPAALQLAWPGHAALRLHQVGQEHPDVAVTNLWAQADSAQCQITAQISQRGFNGRTVTVHLNANGQPLASQQVALQAGPTATTFTVTLAPGSPYEITVDSGDALDVDDHAYGVLPQRDQVHVLLVTQGNDALVKALRAEPTAHVDVVTPDSLTAYPEDAVMIVDAVTLPPQATPRAAGCLFIGCPDPFGLTRPGPPPPSASTAPAQLTHWNDDHPAMADLDPTLFHVSKALPLEWLGERPLDILSADHTAIIAEWSGKPASAGARAPHCIYWLFDLRDSDLPRRLSFPVLLWNTLDYLAGARESLAEPLLTGRPLRLRAASSTPSPTIIGPAGLPVKVRVGGDSWIVTDTTVQGFYRRQVDPTEIHALSLLSARGLKPWAAAAPTSVGAAASLHRAWSGLFAEFFTRRALLALVLALGTLEWLLFHRRIIRIA